MSQPEPGSKKAKELGCTCPEQLAELRLPLKKLYWIRVTCPLHGVKTTDEYKVDRNSDNNTV